MPSQVLDPYQNLRHDRHRASDASVAHEFMRDGYRFAVPHYARETRVATRDEAVIPRQRRAGFRYARQPSMDRTVLPWSCTLQAQRFAAIEPDLHQHDRDGIAERVRLRHVEYPATQIRCFGISVPPVPVTLDQATQVSCGRFIQIDKHVVQY